MTKVLVTRDKLDALVNAYNELTGETGTQTLDELAVSISEIQTGGGDLTEEIYTHDGANRLLVDVSDGENFFFLGSTDKNRAIRIDWGDGTSETTPDSTFSGEFRHAYAKPGKYLIKVTPIGTQYIGSPNCRFHPNLRWGMEREASTSGNGRMSLRAIEYGISANFDGNNFNNMDRCDVTDLCISIPAGTTRNIAFGKYLCSGCKSLRHTKIKIDDGRTHTLPNSFFANCASLVDVELSDAITAFDQSVFSGCESLPKIDLPSALTTLGYACFQGCYALREVDLPATVTSIGDRCFMNCKCISKVIIRNTSAVVTNGGTQTFYGSTIASGTGFVYVPDALLEDYKVATNWADIAAQIKPLSELPE